MKAAVIPLRIQSSEQMNNSLGYKAGNLQVFQRKLHREFSIVD